MSEFDPPVGRREIRRVKNVQLVLEGLSKPPEAPPMRFVPLDGQIEEVQTYTQPEGSFGFLDVPDDPPVPFSDFHSTKSEPHNAHHSPNFYV